MKLSDKAEKVGIVILQSAISIAGKTESTLSKVKLPGHDFFYDVDVISITKKGSKDVICSTPKENAKVWYFGDKLN